MQLFILGILLGSGMVLAAQELKFQLSARSSRRRKAEQDEAIALLDHNMDVLADWDSPGYDSTYQIQTVPDSPCGCHESWTAHYAGWDYTCKCHHTKAEHDLALVEELRATTPDTVWWKQQ
jgi:hypothetical protein